MSIVMRASDQRLSEADVRVVDAHQEIWRRCGRLGRLTWMGVPVLKHPVDLMAYQQIIFDTTPDVIIETGTHSGGSALFLAQMCEHVHHGRVISIDISPPTVVHPGHPRLTYLTGNSVDDSIIEVVDGIARGQAGLVILDSDHTRQHVYTEMRLYRHLVALDSYLIVEDTNINGHPIYPGHGPGPWEAVEDFIADFGYEFQIDGEREYLGTYNPRGYLKRIA
ncbi:MAG TPA: CmcI family methyltransferase [Gemmatimonadales bacterium]|nr:CmcI family methyltransferase [Gemmatimonadales bacterium]